MGGAKRDPRLELPETRKAFLEGIRKGGSFKAGAQAAGITWGNARGWMERDPELKKEAKAAKRKAIRAYEAKNGRVGYKPTPGGVKRLTRLPGWVKFSERRLRLALKSLREDGLMWRAAEAAGLHIQTLVRWHRDPAVGPRMDAAIREGKAHHREHREHREEGNNEGLGEEREGRVLRRGAQDAKREGSEADRAWAALEAAPDTATLPGVPGLTLNQMRRDPAAFFCQVLGWDPWAKQVEIAEAVRDALTTEHTESTEKKGELYVLGREPEGLDPNNKEPPLSSVSSVPSVVKSPPPPLRRIAVRSGNGVGKTAIAARVMLWVLRCWPGSIVVTTAPTTRQVDELLWREARSAYHGAKVGLGGRFYDGRSRWDLGPRRYAIGLSPDRTRAERFQGFHAETLVFIVDEASDVPAPHWEAIKGNVLGGKAVVLAIGNPTQMYGEFFEAFHGKSDLWRPLRISALEVPPIPGMATKEAIEEVRADWGEGSRLWQVRVLGEFPSRSDHGLFEREWLERASRE